MSASHTPESCAAGLEVIARQIESWLKWHREHRDSEHVGMVIFNANGEWEALSTRGTPLGIGFYPTLWLPIHNPPIALTAETAEICASCRRPRSFHPYDLCQIFIPYSSDDVAGALAARRAVERAAPDLLEALKAVVSVADRKTDEFDLARAAIAKATGAS
jgi:hypothetical protein